MAADEGRRGLYPALEPNESGELLVDPEIGHKISYKVYGSKDKSAPTAIYQHGGPGAGSSPSSARFFNPKFRTVVYDQRGSGDSTPSGQMAHNTTWDLVADMERFAGIFVVEAPIHIHAGVYCSLREHLGVEKWTVVFGGSWGSTLCLAYAIKHPDRVQSLVLRGIFLFDNEGMSWLFQKGASEMYPDCWERYAGHIPAGERGDLLGAYYRRVMDPRPEVHMPAAENFVRWELSISKLYMDSEKIESLLEDSKFVLPFARSETAYFVHGGWFPGEEEEVGEHGADGSPDKTLNGDAPPFVRLIDRPKHLAPAGPGGWESALPWILRHTDAIEHIPTAIVHGRQDIVCRPRAAWELHKRLPKSTLEFVHDAGHSDSEPGLTDALVRATDRMLSEIAGVEP